jgi:hypothetical protein
MELISQHTKAIMEECKLRARDAGGPQESPDPLPRMAVILQTMVPPRSSGILCAPGSLRAGPRP